MLPNDVSLVDKEHREAQVVLTSEPESLLGFHLGSEGWANDRLRSGCSFGPFDKPAMGVWSLGPKTGRA